VRAEGPADRGAVAAVLEAAFGRRDEAELVSELRSRASPRLSLVALQADEVVGHVFFSPVRLDLRAGAPVAAGGLAPLGVTPASQGRGVGSALVRAGLSACSGLGWRAVFVLGEPAYYSRFGFELAAPRGLRYESPAFDPGFQLLEIDAGAMSGCRGWVRYDDAFRRL
jgi:putative acetyltransferase